VAVGDVMGGSIIYGRSLVNDEPAAGGRGSFLHDSAQNDPVELLHGTLRENRRKGARF